MADVPKSLYRRYLEVSEATFQALLKNHSAGDVHHYKPVLNLSSPHKGFEGCLPCLSCNTCVYYNAVMNLRGFIDLHTHGIGSFDTRTSCPEDILKMAELHCKAGTGAFLPTIYSGTLGVMRTNMEAVRRAMEMQRSLPSTCQSSMILGLYLEGPFLNPLRCGALDRESFLKPALSSLKKLIEGYEKIVKIITIAPELPGALRVIEKCSEMGIRIHMGHSDGTYTQSGEGRKAGAVGVTHIFNAMRPFHHREPGLVGLGLLDEDLTVEVIADGVHLSPAALKLLFSIKKPEKIILVSDSVRGARRRGRPAYNAQGILEGGGATISGSLGVLRKIGISEEEINECGIVNPLRHLQLDLGLHQTFMAHCHISKNT